MKYFRLSIVLIIIIASFLFFNKDVSNKAVHKMIKSDFRIEVKFWGCFGGGTKTAIAYRKDGKRWLKLTETSFNHSKSWISELTPENEKELESAIIDALENQDDDSCTNYYEYRIDNNSFGFNFVDHGCRIDLSILNSLSAVSSGSQANWFLSALSSYFPVLL